MGDFQQVSNFCGPFNDAFDFTPNTPIPQNIEGIVVQNTF